MARQLNYLFKHGTFRERNYRGAGVALLPLAVSIVEGGGKALRPSFQNVYPTSRYLMFTLFMGGVLFLGAATCRLEGAEVGLTFVALAVTFFPFIADLYNPDADALFIFLFPFFLAFLLRARFGLGGFWPNLIGALVTFFLMGFTKITPVFLVLAAPLLVLLPFTMPRLPKVFVAAGLALLLSVTFFAGGRVSEALQHPNRNIGIKGEPFQETVAWHMIWAAYGTFDHHSAHWFTKSARLRNERVRKITGLPENTYVRHAQSASEQIYKPGVLQAFSERPGYFYATAFLRFYNHGLRFYRYTYGGDSSDVWEPWLGDGFRESRVISGEEVFGLSPEREAIRYDEAWKVSPLILLAKITQSDMTRLADLVLLMLAFIGMIGMRHRGLGAFLVFCALAQIVFAFGIHGINRYFMFCSVALLLGLAYTLCQIVKVILGFRGKTSCLQ
jgi:hypothetical protein